MAAKKDLDLKTLHLLSTPAKCTLAGLVVAGVLALGYFAVFKGQLDNLTATEEKEVELKKTYTQKSIEAASLDNLKAELSSIRTAFDTLLKQLPTDAEIPTLIQELHQAGSNNSLRLDSVTPQTPVNDGPIQKLPYSIAITGKHAQISQFARDVGALSRIITLESLVINQSEEAKNSTDSNKGKNDKSDMLTLSATATTYKARPAEEVAAEVAAASAASAAEPNNGKDNDNK
ncbi:type 4a pilus biogenesis protein PilO [Neisseria sp.]|uniref:type 4a pilus biogenesis protein PilO n=1 Tax=Neisseria sp. TaxID=192066 RepID=UPI0035A0D0D0